MGSMTIVCRRGDCAFCADAYTANDTSSTIANRTNPPFACRSRTFSLFTIHSFHAPGTPAPSTGDDEGERQKRRGWSRSMRRASVKQLLHAYTVAAQFLQQFPGETA